MKRIAVALALSVCAAAAKPALAQVPVSVPAQSAPPAGSFEVASVKPSNPNPTGPLGSTPMLLPALGRLTAQNVTLKMLIISAYQKQPFQIIGGPSWQNDAKFDINAKAADGTLSTDGMLGLLKGLLSDRFKLKLHTETRDVPIFALVLARGDGRLGPKMKTSTDNCPDFKEQQQKMLEAVAKGGMSALQSMVGKPGENKPCSMTNIPPTPANPAIGFQATGQSIDLLVLLLTQLSGRPVVNKTGLTGPYDFELTIDLQTLAAVYREIGVPLPLPPGMPEGRALSTMLQEDLGLKLDAQRGPGELLVIDGAELPTAD